MPYRLRDHTADVAVEATGESLAAAFAAAADGLAAAMCEDPPASGDRFDLEAGAESCEALLFDYLDELIYQRDVRGVLPVANEVAVREAGGEWVAEGSARGVPVAEISAREVKAVTYSEMDLRETDEGWRAYVVFDV